MSKLQTSLKTGKERKGHTWAAAAAMVPTHFVGMWEVAHRERDRESFFGVQITPQLNNRF
jgi:hypothetical protein